MNETENEINDLEHNEAKNNQSEQQKEKRIQKNEGGVRSLWDNFKHSKICMLGLLEEEKDQKTGNLFEKIIKENVPNLVKEIDMQVQEA